MKQLKAQKQLKKKQTVEINLCLLARTKDTKHIPIKTISMYLDLSEKESITLDQTFKIYRLQKKKATEVAITWN